ncbi:hypothetical protein CAPTEDRAFT_218831 [Capitella teleta]|uniref:Uncharacterized protein n=1 Tax=Capitella teleta TaxID=283909 RepID=R7U150_CAPTE|nr:hypothetical protein CAPTEDRAFT_218831 [Capitella teleta]|eukprot:ELT97361.1 hypothetical protein CAPTEDRAFT_218831 [Capitella teleta]
MTVSLKMRHSVDWKQRNHFWLARESRRLKRGLLPSKFFRMTMAFEMFDGWPSASPSCYNETPETPVEKRKASLTSLTPMPDERPLTSPVKSVFESVTSSRPPVGGSTGGGCKKRDQENKGETALDMRMNLTQAKDLLWKTDSVDGDTPLGMRSEDFSSHIQPIQRVRKMQGHMDAVSCIEVDFRRLISGSHDRSIRIWDIRSGRSIHKLYGHKGRISSLKFDEKNILFSASWDTTIMVWDLVTFQRKAVLNGHKGSISCLQLTPEFLVSGSHDHTLRVWSRDSLKCVRIIEGHRSHVLCLHCDRVYAFSGSTDQTVRQTVVRTGELMRVFNTFSEPVYRVLVRRYLLITTSESGLISFSNTESGALECIIQAHNRASVNAICLSQGHLYTAGSDHAIKEWDLSSMACVRSLLGHKMAVLDLKVTQRRIVSSSGDNQIRIWETQIPTSSQGDSSLREDTLPLKIIKQENEPKLDRFQ